MKKIEIFVAAHKPTTVFSNEVYLPIHVGSELGLYKEEMKNYLQDNIGDNISLKNPYYSELTAQYWIWKNIKDVEYVGLCHYRRYFETELTSSNIDDILGTHKDVLLSGLMVEKISLATRLQVFTTLEDFYIFYKCLIRHTQDREKEIRKFLSQNKFTPYNMFVMKKDVFDDFASWQFSILNDMEKYIKYSPYIRGKRVMGYLSEVLLLLYCKLHELNVRFENIVPMIGEHKKKIIFEKLRQNIRDIRYKILSPESIFEDPAVISGMQQDGINIK